MTKKLSWNVGLLCLTLGIILTPGNYVSTPVFALAVVGFCYHLWLIGRHIRLVADYEAAYGVKPPRDWKDRNIHTRLVHLRIQAMAASCTEQMNKENTLFKRAKDPSTYEAEVSLLLAELQQLKPEVEKCKLDLRRAQNAAQHFKIEVPNNIADILKMKSVA